MDKIPFSVYDFFGYLAAGFVLLAGSVAAFAGDDLLNHNPSVIVSILLVVVAYVAGQVIANVAGFLIESKLVADGLGRPTKHLFGVGGEKLSRLLPGYYRPLPATTQARVLERAQARAGITAADEGLFFHCHALVKKEPVALERLNTFLNLYGFCRNVCLALAIVAPALVLGIVLGTAETGKIGPGWWAAGAAIGAVGMFYRYLKFFRQYGVELFTTYAELPGGQDG
jgi:hypothetical protein